MSNKYFFIHGHFYQPSREDAITGVIPNEIGVAPYQNWNERIHAECYKPNAELKNFERISFNIGPTLFSWMEVYDPATYQAIIEQENINYQKYGVGNAMAQPFNHTILPLATRRDKETQVKWGIADFVYRYGHTPSGMWLPEAAVDHETLEILAENGIQFTILAPWQCEEGRIVTNEPFRVNLVNGMSIVVFFYQMDISTRISFDPVSTNNADQFINEYLFPIFKSLDDQELIGVASDGELYGHHQPHRDKFLARLLNGPDLDGLVYYTFPAQYLLDHPVTKTCKIKQNTSWSCHHGISRWYTECGCTPGSIWKAPLREGLNAIAERLDASYVFQSQKYVQDPWTLRNGYIRVMLGEQSLEELLQQNGLDFVDREKTTLFKLLLEAQITRQKMFTSCGFFFEELNRIEPRNNIGYAAQATALMEEETGNCHPEELAALLSEVRSNRIPLTGDQLFLDLYQMAKKNLQKKLGVKD